MNSEQEWILILNESSDFTCQSTKIVKYVSAASDGRQ